MDIKEMRERQQEISAEARKYTDEIGDDTPIEEQRELESKFDKAMADFDDLDKKIERELKLQDAEQRAQQSADDHRIPGNKDDRKSEEQREEKGAEWTEDLAFKTYCLRGADGLTPEARALLKAGRRSDEPEELRALSVGTDAAGGYTVPPGFQNELEREMLAWGPMLDPGITRELVTTSGNNIKWPTVDDTTSTAAIHTEAGAVTDDGGNDPTFAEKDLDAYVYDSEIVRISIELLQDSFTNMDALLGSLLGERLGRAGNSALTVGTGTAQPNGIMTAATSGKTAASATAITFDEIIDLIHSVDPAYRASGSLRFMFNDTTLALLRKIKDGDGNYLWQQADARAGEPATIFGYPYAINQACVDAASTTTPVAFGDFSKYVVRKVTGINVVRMAELFAANLQVGFMAYNRIDGELINANAVKKLTMAV